MLRGAGISNCENKRSWIFEVPYYFTTTCTWLKAPLIISQYFIWKKSTGIFEAICWSPWSDSFALARVTWKYRKGSTTPLSYIPRVSPEIPVKRKIKECCSCYFSISEYFFGKRTYWGTDWCWLSFNWLEGSFQSRWYFIITVATNWAIR